MKEIIDFAASDERTETHRRNLIEALRCDAAVAAAQRVGVGLLRDIQRVKLAATIGAVVLGGGAVVPAVWGKVTIEVSTKMLEQDDYMRHLIDQMKHIFLYVPEMEISNSQISERTRTVRVEGWKLPEDHTERINRNIKNHMKKMELSYNIKEETE